MFIEAHASFFTLILITQDSNLIKKWKNILEGITVLDDVGEDQSKRIKEEIQSRVHEKAARAKARSQMIYFFMLGSSILFTFFSLSFIFFLSDHFVIVGAFHVSTFILFAMSWLMNNALIAARNNEIEKLHRNFHLFFSTVFIFLISQLIGWQHLMSLQQEWDMQGNAYALFLLITIVHFLHILVGLLMAFQLLKKVRAYQVHSKSIMFLNAVTWYWHFLGFVWIVIYIIGVLN